MTLVLEIAAGVVLGGLILAALPRASVWTVTVSRRLLTSPRLRQTLVPLVVYLAIATALLFFWYHLQHDYR